MRKNPPRVLLALGWYDYRLVQTNTLKLGLNTNWFTISGSTATNRMILPIDFASGSVFYRLAYP